jgi:hypothetical protein
MCVDFVCLRMASAVYSSEHCAEPCAAIRGRAVKTQTVTEVLPVFAEVIMIITIIIIILHS